MQPRVSRKDIHSAVCVARYYMNRSFFITRDLIHKIGDSLTPLSCLTTTRKIGEGSVQANEDRGQMFSNILEANEEFSTPFYIEQPQLLFGRAEFKDEPGH